MRTGSPFPPSNPNAPVIPFPTLFSVFDTVWGSAVMNSPLQTRPEIFHRYWCIDHLTWAATTTFWDPRGFWQYETCTRLSPTVTLTTGKCRVATDIAGSVAPDPYAVKLLSSIMKTGEVCIFNIHEAPSSIISMQFACGQQKLYSLTSSLVPDALEQGLPPLSFQNALENASS